MKKNLMHSNYLCVLLALSSLSSADAQILGQWTFNDRANVATALQSSNVSQGAIVSSLVMNPSHDSAGANNVPNTVNDGFGFGLTQVETITESVMFFNRAEYFNNEPDTANGGIRPVGRVTTWDSSSTTVANSPISFTVTADAISTLTIQSLDVHKFSGASLILAFQAAGGTMGNSITLAPGTQTLTVSLSAPVVIQPGQSTTFTIYVNSGDLNSGHNLNQISLNGSITRNTAIPSVAQWTFNSTGSGTTAQRLPVALGASSVASGLTVTPLSINPSFVEFAGFNNVPGSTNDGYGFGGSGTNQVMFIHRANYFNSASTPTSVTTWGSPVNTPGIDTTIAKSPLSFTVTTNSVTTATLNSLNIAGVGNNATTFVHFQEAAATIGVSSLGSTTDALASLRAPVVIGPNQTKTFTVSLNSGSLNSAHIFNTISLNGTTTVGNTYNTWAAANAGNQTGDLDFDNDGIANGIEFFMGETGNGFTTRPVPVNGTITWPRDSSANVSSFRVQVSDTLNVWTDIAPANLDLSNPSQVRYTLIGGAPRQFVRLVVTP